ncbi:MAG TPA: sulfatase-like hydrolase/transferase [Candidatus Limiplasma sp.]|nr:sulfatase-like hydrolase/transferase [Candidatus Limiplasma sp.]
MSARKPDVVFILADDQRFDTIAALHHPQIKTPNLDRLARRGTVMTNAYIPGGTSGAVCMPSRAMLHTGRTLFHLQGEGQEIPIEHRMMGECFRENGYHTVGIGKWHNGTGAYARSFSDGDNIFFGGMWDHWNVPVCGYHPDGRYENKVKATHDFFYANHPMELIAEKISVGKHSTELLTDSAVEFLSCPQAEPLFMYVSLLAPHDPRTMPEAFQRMYNPDDIILPKSFAAAHPFYFGVGDESRDEALAAHPRTEAEIRRHIADYYAMISHLDFHVGRVMDTLDKAGRLENTIIVFAGDNGLAVGRHGLMGKQNLYDHSVHVPLIMAGPGIARSSQRGDLCYLLDVFPTLCDLCAIPIPASVEGKSFAPALHGGAPQGRDLLYGAYTGLIRSVCDGRYKLIEYQYPREATQLFDLRYDPQETVNLYAKAEHGEVVRRLREAMLALRGAWEDDADNPHTRAFWEHAGLDRR